MDDGPTRSGVKRALRLMLRTCSGFTMTFQLGQLHEASHMTVILKTGLRLGFIEATGNA